MSSSPKIFIVGIGDNGADGLTSQARQLVEQAELLVGAEHTLALIPKTGAERLVIGADLDDCARRLADERRKVVVLASGDPLFYGVARYLCSKLGKDRFEVAPHVSSMQLAFARVKESWEEAYLTDLAARPLEAVIERVRSAEKVGLFTTDAVPPSAVAKALLERRIDYFSGYVCENLGSPDERVTQGTLADLAEMEFSPLNCMILIRKPDAPDRPVDAQGRRLFGNPDEVFLQSKPKSGLLTPAEIRSVALAELDLGPASVVWDIGAGSGSVAIEAAQIATGGRTFAIEMDAADHALILENAERCGVTNLVAILGRAPDAWTELPAPDAVFVGGTGREIGRLAVLAYERLKLGGRLVAHMSTIDGLSEVFQGIHRLGPDPKVWMFHLARGTYQLERIRFESLNPSFMLSVVKPK